MTSLGDYKDILEDIATEWDKAEEDIKTAEQINNEIVFPSIMELRYAGRRIVDALNKINAGDDPAVIKSILDDARFDCHRARHDAIDSTLSTISIQLDNMYRYLGADVILTARPDFSEFWARFSEARESIAESRGNREDRERVYKTLEENDFRKIVSEYQKIKFAEPLMRQIHKKNKVWKRISVGMFLVGVLTLVVGIL